MLEGAYCVLGKTFEVHPGDILFQPAEKAIHFRLTIVCLLIGPTSELSLIVVLVFNYHFILEL